MFKRTVQSMCNRIIPAAVHHSPGRRARQLRACPSFRRINRFISFGPQVTVALPRTTRRRPRPQASGQAHEPTVYARDTKNRIYIYFFEKRKIGSKSRKKVGQKGSESHSNTQPSSSGHDMPGTTCSLHPNAWHRHSGLRLRCCSCWQYSIHI